ncbi:MAG: MFS transporter [Bacteroidales bacterium]|nr:MFS transporter [Candidatus Sodaliphilus aphodohippi]
MKERIANSISQYAYVRWIVLAIVSVTMMTGYIVAKQVSPLEFLLESPISSGGMGWTSGEFGLFAGSRGFFNVFFLMLFFGGIILDKTGVKIAGILSCILMLVGTVVDYYSIAFVSPSIISSSLFAGTKMQVLISSLGFAIFGIGYELCGITVSKVIVKWFTGKEMALAMGIQVALARLGTALALGYSARIAISTTISTPILVGVFALGVGFIGYLAYCMIDTNNDNNTDKLGEDDKFHFADLKLTLTNKGFWLITFLCMLYYSSLYPFLDFATKLMITKYSVDVSVAGMIPAILPFTSIILTPLFGAMYDRIGRGATIMIIGTVMLTIVLMIFSLPSGASMVAIVSMLVLGIAFSLLPSVLWPAVPKIVPVKQLGTAYSIIYYIQNIGLILVPAMIGKIIEFNTAADGTPNYTQAMYVFTIIGIAAIGVAVALYFADKKQNYGLEIPNSK